MNIFLTRPRLVQTATGTSVLRLLAFTALFGSLLAAGPLHAADSSDSDSDMDQSQPAAPAPAPAPAPGGSMQMKGHGSQTMQQHVETRIKTLHDKLKITSDQESKWNDVAQVMRDNESDISQQIDTRRQNAANMTAVDDLQSYANITQSHADGLKKLIPAFQALYNDMSDDQKKNADTVFASFEGHHGGMKHHKKHK
jgi:hypothetical protein